MSIEYDQDSFLAGLAFARNVVGWVGGRGESWINESTVTTFNGVLIGANGYVTAKPLRDIVDISYDDPVTSRAVASALSSKQDTLTFDQTPQAGSSNPVYSNGIAVQLNLKAPLDSPSFIGTPHAPTPTAGASNTQIATTEFVMNAIASGGGGGTEVIANPTGAATDTLNTIQIEQVIYNIASGGGGSTTYNAIHIWTKDAASFNANLYIQTGTITNDTFTATGEQIILAYSSTDAANGKDYGDLVNIKYLESSGGGPNWQVKAIDSVAYNSIIYASGDVLETWVYNQTKNMTVRATSGSGGGGTEVIANPTAEATDTLNKLQVGQTVYSIAGGSGSGGVDYLTVVDGKICVIYEVT